MSVCLSHGLALHETASSPEPLASFSSWLVGSPSDLHIDALSDYFSFLGGALICDPLELQKVPEVRQNSMTMK